MAELEGVCKEIIATKQMIAIKGIGLKIVVEFLARDIECFQTLKQIQKLADLALKKNCSGKHKGETCISRSGRKRLRRGLFTVAS